MNFILFNDRLNKIKIKRFMQFQKNGYNKQIVLIKADPDNTELIHANFKASFLL